ncbi:type III-B CRISPR module RAMP protein Cmr6 [uncultured Thiodictyon sp.]|uniref:type III-B CRISPR module RAMP protein Cmr6 n=1 Tax=uncultured Thiodictyon sp. TaxID=1846217 RepID=UPI0025DCAE6A|nr:type III-B CRISPR module RAMP protein Cmr6 [uncultured Thiodictyon sp.]
MTQLIRTALKPLYRAARDAHPGLLIQRGYEAYDDATDEGRERKTQHIKHICAIPAGTFYVNAFNRWSTITSDRLRFCAKRLDLESRLFIGLTAGGMLETGCAISHSYGVPYLMGSSVKGAVNAFVRGTEFGQAHSAVCNQLFGSEPQPGGEHPDGLAGVFTFHDAWWIPGSAPTPMVQEVVTTHHLEYYGSEGEAPASDLDSPIPNAQIAVRGAFLFAIEGPLGWMHLAEQMLVATLTQSGLGAKRRAGYGYFRDGASSTAAGGDGTGGGDGTRCQWVDDALTKLMQQNRAPEGDTLRSIGLAQQWQAIPDADLKEQALADIRTRWQTSGWWDEPPSKKATQAKAIYQPTEAPG